MLHANQVVSHRELLQAIWGSDYGHQVEYLRVFIKASALSKIIPPQLA
jgi:DNA-binding response OmpR family regulator